MPNFDYNPADASAGFPIYPDGTYQFELGEPKSFYNAGKNGKDDNHGVRFVCKCVEAEEKKWVGKKFSIQCFQHSQGARDYSKNIQMAALGYARDQESEFDEDHGHDDWKYNTDDGSCGDGWQQLKGTIIEYDLSIKIGDEGEKQQNVKAFRPI